MTALRYEEQTLWWQI